ncbi:MAG: heavy metal translocating P-type ATPase metal-binding domain-containing protein [Methylovulum sp.]|nr:heavy metal translocating P-type ATPase metal-binding domain-containing protein [Methylovulum sp.]
MNDNNKNCDLCGLVVEVDGFRLLTKEGDKAFCCEGCKGIYEMLNEDEALPESDESN